MILQDIYIYPIKSLQGVRVPSALLDKFGLQYDRRWMLVDKKNQMVTQRTVPELSLFTTELQDESIRIGHKILTDFTAEIPYWTEGGKHLRVKVWSDECQAIEVSPAISTDFSLMLGLPVRLVYLPDDATRDVDSDFAFDGEQTSFSDGFPLLAISTESLEELNSKLEKPVSMERFRPNLVISGGHPHWEDELEYFSIGTAGFKAVKPCSRCTVTTVNPKTGETGKEPLKTLATYRTQKGKIMFGMNILHHSSGEEISCGEEILER